MKKHRKKRYRNEIRVNSNRKRIVSLTMVLVLCLMLLPASAFAAEDSGAAIGTGGLCAHHTEHDDTCGYVEGIAESPCTHEHSEDCYTEVTRTTKAAKLPKVKSDKTSAKVTNFEIRKTYRRNGLCYQ